jgi:hypothetical protein
MDLDRLGLSSNGNINMIDVFAIYANVIVTTQYHMLVDFVILAS